MKEENFASSILKEPVYGYFNNDGSIKNPVSIMLKSIPPTALAPLAVISLQLYWMSFRERI
jgi:ABC-type nitrate/sulfonate/bicarbonate transport system permease component